MIGLVVDFDDVLGSSASVASVDQTSGKPEAGSNQNNTCPEALLENTRHRKKNTQSQKQIRGARYKCVEPKINTRQQIILVHIEQHRPMQWQNILLKH